MPEEITQRLGFDASSAITSLGNLQGKLNEFKQGLQAVSGALRKFPNNAGQAIAAMRTLTAATNDAARAVAGLATAGAVPSTVGTSAKNAASAMSNFGDKASIAGAKVKQAVTQSFNQAAGATNKIAQSAGVAGAAVASSSNKIAASANKVGNAMQDAGVKGKESAALITLSWKTIARVIQAQLIVRTISSIVRAFKEAQEAATEFSLRIGEVATISGDALGTIGQISDATLELSRSLGLAADEVAEGLYQTLSNQVVEAGDALKFEEAAAKLSITTHSELKDSVNALSSVMNSYGLDVSEVDRVSAVLFKTIELGRLRMGEFGNVLGRVAPLTQALGIEYEEMAAALAALTQKGVPAHTAITQLTQVSQKLLRPTKGLQELYEKWGVDTGPEAIRRFGGLQGVLLKMKDATAGNDTAFADLLGRVRAMVGALNLTTDGASALTEALEAMIDPTEDFEEASAKMESTIGRRSVKAWNDLDVSMIQAGDTLLRITTPMIEATAFLARNMDLVTGAVIGLGIAALAMTGKLAAMATGIAAVSISLAGLQAALFAVAPVLLIVGGALAIVAANRALQDSLDKSTELTEKQTKRAKELTKAHEKESKARIAATRKEFDERRKLTGKFFSDEATLIRKSTNLLNISSDAISKTLERRLDDLASQRKKAIKSIEEAVLGMDDAIKDSADIIKETQADISEAAFEQGNRSLNERQKLWREITRVQQTATEARRAYSEAGASEEKIRLAREKSELAENRAEEAVSAAEALSSTFDLQKAERALAKIRKDRITAEKRFQSARKALQTDVHKSALANLKLEGEKYDQILKQISELIKPTTAKGKAKTEEEIRADKKRAEALVPALRDAMEKATDMSLFDRLQVPESMAKLRAEMVDAFADATFNWDNVISDFRTQLTDETYSIGVLLTIKNEDFLSRFEARFGKLDVFSERTLGQAEQVAEKTIEDFEGFGEKVIHETDQVSNSIDNMIERLRPDQWNTWADDRSAKERAYRRELNGTNAALARSIDPQEVFRMGLVETVKILKTASNEQRAITAEEKKKINFVLAYGRAAQANGEFSENQTKQAIGTVKALKDGVKSLQDLQAAAAAQPSEGARRQAESTLLLLEEASKTSEASSKKLAEQIGNVSVESGKATTALGQTTTAVNVTTAALKRSTDQATALKNELQGARNAQQDVLQQGGGAGGVIPAPDAKDLETPADAAKRLSDDLSSASTNASLLNQEISTVSTSLGNMFDPESAIAGGLDQSILTTQTLGRSVDSVTQSVSQTDNQVLVLKGSLDQTGTSIKTAGTATNQWSSGMNSLASAALTVESAMNRAAAASIRAAQAVAQAAAVTGGGVGNAYYGGPAAQYKQAGGFASRGNDSIPIMASPGEFIMNSKSSRKFASELQAMNGGQKPIFRDRGGSVTNVGDINVSVSQGESSSQSARNIATALRRELRRGTSRLS